MFCIVTAGNRVHEGEIWQYKTRGLQPAVETVIERMKVKVRKAVYSSTTYPINKPFTCIVNYGSISF